MFKKESCSWSKDDCKAFKISFLGALAAIVLVMIVCGLFAKMHGMKWMGKKMDGRMDFARYEMQKGMPNPMMLEKLGMTQEELDMEIESGKTMIQIMEENGMEMRMCKRGKECPMMDNSKNLVGS